MVSIPDEVASELTNWVEGSSQIFQCWDERAPNSWRGKFVPDFWVPN
jgi:hypothetical protein